MTPRCYLLCTSPRSGSTMLCGMLAATGIAGDPESFFHRSDRSSWARDLGLDSDAPMKAIIAAVRATATDGLCGIRVQSHSLGPMMAALADNGDTDAARIESAFGSTRYIWLRRQDKLAQAISYLRAEQSGLWHRKADGSDLERLAPRAPAGYDAAAITAQIKAFEAADATWDRWFSDQGVTPLRLTYESLQMAPQASLAEVLRAVGRDPSAAKSVKVPTARLADSTTDKWIAQYRSEVLAKRPESR